MPIHKVTNPQGKAQKPALKEDWRKNNAGRILSNALRRFEDRVLAILAELGHPDTRGSHVNLTRHLDLDGTRITLLARRAAMTNAAMTELIDQCATLGLVERHEDPADRRARVVRFTAKGRRWLADFGQAVSIAERELETEISAKSFDRILADLSRYGASVESLAP